MRFGGLSLLLSLFLSNRLRLLDHPMVRPLLLLSVYAIVTVPLGVYPRENIVFAVKLVFVLLVFVSALKTGPRNVESIFRSVSSS